MNARSVPEWMGRDLDDPVPMRVRDRVLIAFDRKCAEPDCKADIRSGDKWICDHEIAIINGGENRERNLRPLCHLCARKKDATDVAIKSKNYRIRCKHYGIWEPKGPPMPGTRRSGLKRKMDGTVERRK